MLLGKYEELGIVMEQAEILKEMYNNSISIYNREITEETLEESLGAVDIKLLEREMELRKKVWVKKVKELLSEDKGDKRWKYTE